MTQSSNLTKQLDSLSKGYDPDISATNNNGQPIKGVWSRHLRYQQELFDQRRIGADGLFERESPNTVDL